MYILKDRRARRVSGKLRQRGLSLVETAAVLGVASIAMTAFASIMSDNTDQLKAKSVAEKVVEVQNAAKDYVKANNAELLAATASDPIVIPVGREAANGNIPAGPQGTNLPSIQGGGYLSPTFVDRNGYNQRHAVIVRQTQLPTGERRLDAVVTTYGGSPVPDRQLQRIAGYIGASGGYVPRKPLPGEPTGVVVGVQGGWRAPVDTWGEPGRRPEQGAVVATMAYDVGTTLNDYLYRNDIGIPEANRMNTDIDMNGKRLDNASVVKGVVPTGETERKVIVEDNLSAIRNIEAGINIWAKEGTVRAKGDISSDEGNLEARKGKVVAKSLEDADNANFIVDPSDLSVMNNIQTAFLNLDTIVYGNSRGLNAAQNVRLGDLLPKLVAQGKFYPTRDNPYVAKPRCPATATPQVTVAMREDSQKFDVKLKLQYADALAAARPGTPSAGTPTYPSYPGYPYYPTQPTGPDGTTTVGDLEYGLIFDRGKYLTGVESSGRETMIARQYHVADYGSGHWMISVTGTPNADDASGDFPWVMEATTYCEYP